MFKAHGSSTQARRLFATKPITDVSPLTAISPIDGRYAKAAHSLRPFFSEFALMRYRVQVELHWFKRLFTEKIVSADDEATLKKVEAQSAWLDSVFDNFSVADGERVKEIEKTTNHDVKAIEYFLKEKFDENPELANLKEYLHFSCTSEDINNLAYALMLHSSMQEVMLPQLRDLHANLSGLAAELADVPMMCRTHG